MMSPKEAAKFLSVSVLMVRRLYLTRQIGYSKPSPKAVRIPIEELEAYLTKTYKKPLRVEG